MTDVREVTLNRTANQPETTGALRADDVWWLAGTSLTHVRQLGMMFVIM